MRNTILYIIIGILMTSCTSEESNFLGKISGFIIYSETGVQSAVYYFAYDNEGRLSEKSSPLGQESVVYNEQEISQWIRVVGNGTKTENYHYESGQLNNISIDYEFPLSGIDLVEYLYEANKCVQKTEMLNNEAVNIYHYLYGNNGLIDEVHLERKVQNDTLFYVYEYDNSGSVSEIYLDGNSYASFKYTTLDNPLFEVSKPHLIKVPVGPDYVEKPPMTSRYLLSKEIYYAFNGTVEEEISYTYTLNDKAKPGIATRIFNGKDEEIIYTYY